MKKVLNLDFGRVSGTEGRQYGINFFVAQDQMVQGSAFRLLFLNVQAEA